MFEDASAGFWLGLIFIQMFYARKVCCHDCFTVEVWGKGQLQMQIANPDLGDFKMPKIHKTVVIPVQRI